MFKTNNQKNIDKKVNKDQFGRIVITDTTETIVEIDEILQQEEILKTNRKITIRQLEYIDRELKGIQDIKDNFINSKEAT